MRRQIKKKFGEAVFSLKKAEKALKHLIGRREADDEIKQLLEDMQNCAIEVGNSIEEVQGEGTETVSRLEEYCDLLWKCYTAEDAGAREEILQLIHNKQNEISDTLDREFSEEKEVVFVVFRRDMWDGIEKLWREFGERQDCVCYLIPAPFYEKKADGSVVRCYEGSEFPDELPVVWYEDYEWESGDTDVILLQGTEKNDGRQIWPDEKFQKEQLESYADLLVEIPYGENRDSE